MDCETYQVTFSYKINTYAVLPDRWTFDPNNNVAHAVWMAFHDHTEGQILHGNVWNPTTVNSMFRLSF